jgi:hypothetical protein
MISEAAADVCCASLFSSELLFFFFSFFLIFFLHSFNSFRFIDSYINKQFILMTQSTSGQFHFRRTAFSSQLKSKVGNILAKSEALRITLNIHDTTITSRSHTHPSHSQTSRLLTSSLSLGVPVPRPNQCM